MNNFKEIEGGVLKEVSTTKATYVGIDSKKGPMEINGFSFEFDIGIFVIENPFTIVNPQKEKAEISNLIGLKVVSAYCTKSVIGLNFEKGYSLSVSMKDEDYTGPEAASFAPHKGNIIVFN
ncbi:MAG: hypothetical protein HUN04_16015 [Desulfobacter sp.]|nr:MAG: hypothetical protein HUN04_16015 [Desulfobacter sp.]